ATNRDLEKAVAEGTFREDLYYRLSVVTITLPPLRERKGDIPILSNYILTRLATEMGISNPGILQEAMQKLNSYEWPGNIRELSNVLKKAMIFNRGGHIQLEDLSINDSGSCMGSKTDALNIYSINNCKESVRQWIRQTLLSEKEETPSDSNLFDSCLDYVAEMLIIESLNITSGNRSRAAKILGISRPTFHSKIEKYQIKIGSSVVKD
ncbi:MAG: sigma-54-dependent Fis family transcriptional regulator, partial [Desulfamplus sp.]|nr:sigma-54-dependent Fis family transcriptional regulator [Desulfamplus sp.]